MCDGHRRSATGCVRTPDKLPLRQFRRNQHPTGTRRQSPCSAWIPLSPATRQAAVDVRQIQPLGACLGEDEPNGSCRVVEGYVNAQTTLRTWTCDRRARPNGVAWHDVQAEQKPAHKRPLEGRCKMLKTIKIRSYEIGLRT